jgi:hypothetical protein
MECWKTTRALAAWLDDVGTEEERREIQLHLAECAGCAEIARQYQCLRRELNSLPTRAPSEHLKTVLKVTASKEQARRVTHITYAKAFAAWKERMAFSVRTLMQPLALPITGGLLSALILFTALVPDFTVGAHSASRDVPTILFTEASVKDMMPIGIDQDSELVIELTVDEYGRMTDYEIVRGNNLLHDEQLRRAFENALLAAQFTPATAFGQPTSGKIRVSFRTSVIEVKG